MPSLIKTYSCRDNSTYIEIFFQQLYWIFNLLWISLSMKQQPETETSVLPPSRNSANRMHVHRSFWLLSEGFCYAEFSWSLQFLSGENNYFLPTGLVTRDPQRSQSAATGTVAFFITFKLPSFSGFMLWLDLERFVYVSDRKNWYTFWYLYVFSSNNYDIRVSYLHFEAQENLTRTFIPSLAF